MDVHVPTDPRGPNLSVFYAAPERRVGQPRKPLRLRVADPFLCCVHRLHFLPLYAVLYIASITWRIAAVSMNKTVDGHGRLRANMAKHLRMKEDSDDFRHLWGWLEEDH